MTRRTDTQLVTGLEQAVIELLSVHHVVGERREGAPGVYVAGRKLAALGLRVRRGGSYHGLSLNVAMDLEPFAHIDPCGYEGLEVTQLSDLGVCKDTESATEDLLPHLLETLGYNSAAFEHAQVVGDVG